MSKLLCFAPKFLLKSMKQQQGSKMTTGSLQVCCGGENEFAIQKDFQVLKNFEKSEFYKKLCEAEKKNNNEKL
ncbi:hypothetical protein ABK040_008985 [Willaertia magna]